MRHHCLQPWCGDIPVRTRAHRHDAVREVEGLLHAISVVDVDVHVQHALEALHNAAAATHASVLAQLTGRAPRC